MLPGKSPLRYLLHVNPLKFTFDDVPEKKKAIVETLTIGEIEFTVYQDKVSGKISAALQTLILTVKILLIKITVKSLFYV